MTCDKAISEKEWQELLALEYVLTHGYSDDIDEDTKKYMYLSDRKHFYGFSFDSDEYYKCLVKIKNDVK